MLLFLTFILFPDWPSFPEDFVFGYYLHRPAKKLCIRTYERFRYSVWTFFLFCSADNKRDPGFRWSDMGTIPGMRCTRIYEPKEKFKRTWDDNFLCIDPRSPYRCVALSLASVLIKTNAISSVISYATL